MKQNLDTGLKLIKRHEGGYVDHPRDPGGCTNLGITIGTYRREINRRGTCADLRRMNWETAAKIYRKTYWGQVSGDRLPDGLDVMLLDFGVNAGPKRAVKLLQKVLGVDRDGIIGPRTLQAAFDADIPELLHDYSDARLAYYRRLKTWKTFGKGWTRRTKETLAKALDVYKDREITKPEKPGVPASSAMWRQLVFSRGGAELMRLPLPLDLSVHIEEVEGE